MVGKILAGVGKMPLWFPPAQVRRPLLHSVLLSVQDAPPPLAGTRTTGSGCVNVDTVNRSASRPAEAQGTLRPAHKR